MIPMDKVKGGPPYDRAGAAGLDGERCGLKGGKSWKLCWISHTNPQNSSFALAADLQTQGMSTKICHFFFLMSQNDSPTG